MEGPNSKQEYRVAVGNLSVWLPESELKAVTGKTKSDPDRKRKLLQAFSSPDSSPAPLKLDLHGLTVAQATDALERTIDQAILKGAPRIEVIHGIGSGALKRAVVDYLSKSSHIASFNADERNPGTTWINL